VPSTGLWNNVAGLAVVPIAVWLIASGHGLLIERVARVRFPNALVVSIGFCSSVVVALGAYETGIGNDLAVPVVVSPAVLGLALARRELLARLNAGWPLLAGIAAYVLFNLSVIALGHWTLTAYNIENDSAYELVLIAHLQAHGTSAASGPPSTANSVITAYLSTGYPLGAQSLLGVVSGLLGVSAAVVWQGFISAMAGVGTMAASLLSGRTMNRRLAATAGLLAMGSALSYQYALQGSIKEVGCAVAVLSALAVMRYAILSLDGSAAVAVSAIPLAAILAIFNAAGIPFAGALAVSGAIGMLLVRRQRPQREWFRPALLGSVVLAIFAIPALLTLGTYLRVASSAYSGSNPTAPPLGPLLRPLPFSEMSGVWLYGDYRLPVPPGTGAVITVVVTVGLFTLLAPGVLRMVKARESGPLMGLITMALVLAIVYPRVTPYAQAKLLMIASPILVLSSLQALTAARGLVWNGLARMTALAIGAAVLASDALAYHAFPVAPTDRLLSLQEIGKRLGARGPVLDSEFEQFAKYFAQPAQLIDGPDAPTPEPLVLRNPAPQYDHSFDLNEEQLSFIESFPFVLIRRSPVSSRPPANYKLVVENTFYELWQREASPRVYSHLSLGGYGVNAGRPPGCRALRSIVAAAPRGARLAVATRPATYGYELANASVRSPGWVADAGSPGGFLTLTPGLAQKSVRVHQTGFYETWIQANLPRRVAVTVDGHKVGSAQGSNTPGQWLSAGVIGVAAGRHTLGVVRGGAGLGPGNGGTQAAIGAVAISLAGESAHIWTVPLRRWRSLCGTEADWIEVVRAA
jgi:hypothetical protein